MRPVLVVCVVDSYRSGVRILVNCPESDNWLISQYRYQLLTLFESVDPHFLSLFRIRLQNMRLLRR